MKAVKKFKRLTDPTKPQTPIQSMFGGSILGGDNEAYFVEPPMEMDPDEPFPAVGGEPPANNAHSLRAGMRKAFGRRRPFAGLRTDSGTIGSSDSASLSSRPVYSPNSSKRPSGVFEPERKYSDSIRNGMSPAQPDICHEARSHSRSASPHIPLSRTSSATTKRSLEGTRGHARDPLEEEFPYLFIGPSAYTGSSHQDTGGMIISDEPSSILEEPGITMNNSDQLVDDEPVQIVSESPGAADFNIYETAYRMELDRIKHSLKDRDTGPKVYLNRRIEKNSDEVMRLAKEKALDLQIGERFTLSSPSRAPSAFGSAVSALRSHMLQKRQAEGLEALGKGDGDGEPTAEKDVSRDQEPHPHPPKRLSIPSQSVPEPEPSTLEATGVSSTEGSGDSKAQLRRLLDRVRGKADSAE